jgi:hypothetical protein
MFVIDALLWYIDIEMYNSEGKKMHAKIITTVLVAACFAAFSSSLFASPFVYQGSLMENGEPANGSYDMVFQLTDAPVIGFLLDSDSVNNVPVVDGLFTVEIDFDDTLMNSDNRWLAIVVEGTTLSPRTRLRPAPRAYNAVRANTAGSLEAPAFMSASNATLNALATSSTGTALLGTHTNSTGTAPGIHARTNSISANAIGLLGEVDPTNPGGLSAGVRGINNGTAGLGIGVYGSHAGSGWGIYGTTPDGRGVYGNSTSGIGVYARSADGVGLFATHSSADIDVTIADDTYGVFATNDSQDGIGTAIRGSGGRTGVYGESTNSGFGPSLTRTGVQGFAGSFSTGADTFYGVHGFGQAPAAGGSRTSYGVYGGAQVGTSGNTAYGVYGETFGPGGTQFAGYFRGNVHVLGTLSKSSGSFKIDHPLEPETKYLSHSFVESPDMMNIYNGVITLDNTGSAIVTLPDYFQSLNRSFRYQLTPMGAPMPNLYVSSEISSNEFAIAGGASGNKVSWQITGVRQDPSALAHPIIVEEDKPQHLQGKYLDPEAFGLDSEHSIHPRPKQPEQPQQ